MGESKRREASRANTPRLPASEYPGDDWQGNVASVPSLAPGKSCGSCTKCCTVMGVPELTKRAGNECVHVGVGRGCTIYSERPLSCRKFICGWLLDPYMGPDLKPDKCHIVFLQLNDQNIIGSCDDNYPDAWRKPNVIEFLHRLARSLGPDRRVILRDQGRIWVVKEDAVVPADTG
jgi:hypothetical protein